MDSAVADLRALIGSRHRLVFAEARDEQRLLSCTRAAAEQLGFPVWTWSAAGGLQAQNGHPQMNTANPNQALSFIRDLGVSCVAVFLDADHLLDDPVTARLLKELATPGPINLTVMLTGIRHETTAALDSVSVRWRLQPADREEIQARVDQVLTQLRASSFAVDVPDSTVLVDAVLGLSPTEAERLILKEAIADNVLDGSDVQRIHRARAELLSQDSPLDLMDTDVTLASVGGLESLKEWLAVRGRGFEPAAKEFGLEAPKGMLLVGVPGCGKSLVARGLAGSWGMALAALDTSRLHGSLVGESEKRVQRALDAAELMAPVVLWIDEIEKAFSGSSDRDGGVSGRVMSVLLKWLQERPDGVFIVATSNDVTKLPPEMTRRGRFDEVFFVDLPNPSERLAIMAHNLRSRGRDPQLFDADALVAATEGFSGAEIESAVTAALYLAFASEKDLTTEDLIAEMDRTVPLSRMRPQDIETLRQWGRTRARPAS